ncbi:MAG: hypothetical protein JWO67_4814 [Streptosporangiaceae bacterium]|nr:hypothetical protein [Streptosporangiaceae bacterium]
MTAINTHPALTDTAHVVPADAPDAATAATDRPRPDGAAGAVWDALTANPGGTTMAIANAAKVSRTTAAKALAAMADAGHAVRTPGGRSEDGKPVADTWATVEDATPATDPDATTDPDAVTGTVAPDIVTSDAGSDAVPAAEVTSAEQTDPTTAPDSATEEAGGDEAAPADPAVAPAVPAMTGPTVEDAMQILAAEEERRATAESELQKALAEEEARRAKAVAELHRARTTEDTRRALADLLAAVTTTYAAVISGDTDAVAAGLEAIYTETASVRRVTKPTPTRTSAAATATPRVTAHGERTAPRPLRPSVSAHLAAHPGKEFTPGEIAKVLGRSSGAVANALDSLVKQDEAELTGERPNRYRAVTSAAPVAAPDAVADADAHTAA